jgi:hypothetical protein
MRAAHGGIMSSGAGFGVFSPITVAGGDLGRAHDQRRRKPEGRRPRRQENTGTGKPSQVSGCT